MLFKFSEKLYADMEDALGAVRLELEEKEVIRKLEQSIGVCIRYCTRLRDFFKEAKPKEKPELIRFFKETKPRFKAQLIYYQRLLDIEGRKPPKGNVEVLTGYYLEERKSLLYFFEGNREFYRYIRSGDTYLDEQYFLPGVFNVHLCPDENIVDGDTEFTTSHDNKLARVLANELIALHLEKAVLKLNNRGETDLSAFIEEEMVCWTQTGAALVESIYGWKETNALNHGKLSIARMSAYMEKVFHVDLGNVSDTWNYIRGRANATIYLDDMKKAVIGRMHKKL